MKPLYSSLFVLALTCASASAGVGQGSVQLRLRVNKGQKFAYSAKNVVKQSGMSRQTVTSTATQTMAVTDKTAKGITMRITQSNTKMSVSQGAVTPNMIPNMEKAANQFTMTATYNDRGKIVGTMSAGGSQMMQQSNSLLSQAGVGFVIEYPEAPVRVGTSWTTTLDIGQMMKGSGLPAGMKVSGGKLPLKYTVKSIRNRRGQQLVTLDLTGSGSVTLTSSAQGQPLTIKTTISLKGTTVVDGKTGILISSNSTGLNEMDFNGMKLNQNISSTLTRR